VGELPKKHNPEDNAGKQLLLIVAVLLVFFAAMAWLAHVAS
jgi:hypothetical protein